MSFSEYDVIRRTRKGNFLKQIDQLIDWDLIEMAISVHYAPGSDVTGRPAYLGCGFLKCYQGNWNGGLSDGETYAQPSYMQVIAVTRPGIHIERRWVKKGGLSVFGYKQHTLVDHNGLVMAVETTAANCPDSKLLLTLLDKAEIMLGTRVARLCGRSQAHAWHILQAMAYNLKRLPRLYIEGLLPRQP